MRRASLLFPLMLVAAGCNFVAGGVEPPTTPAATAAAAAVPATAPSDPAPAAGTVPAGRFGCTRSVYRAVDGTYEYQPRGFVEFDGTGGYAYLGFESPSEGRVVADGAVRRFSGGHLDGGEFVPVEDRPGQFTLTAPGIDERWSCRDAASG